MAKRVVAAVLLVALANRADAQRAEADAAFERGRQLMKDGDYAAACEAFETSLRFEATIGTLYNLGLCHEKLGKLATAYTELKQVAATDANKGRAADAAKRVTALEPRLTRMKLAVAEPAPGLVVERDGLDITTLVGQVVPVDPKTYTFTATAPGRQTFTTQIVLDKEGETIDVQIPALAASTEDPRPDPKQPAILATGYPTQLALRPWLLPDGTFEATALSAVSTSDTMFDQTPVDGGVQARIAIQMFELGVAATFHLRHSQMTERPNPWRSVSGTFAYAITPAFAARLAYTRFHPVGDRGNGSDIRVSMLRKQLVAPRIALVGSAGFVYQDRDFGASVTELVADAVFGAQLTATPRLSFEGVAELGVNLGGDLYDHTISLGVAPLAHYAATNEIDVFARIFIGLLPAVDGSSSNDFRSYMIGLNYRH